ncbi:uncharacterized protein ARMOST_13841 [Armillaria ostoyae]|uniref:Uncharacterized protein n=1 Tax=Armillaria ostoyae TaxID=47428 RepID=A0A284RP18_ARMOS|nr:uncharacterized protein ARMOST_13841 [Armillaria ostoyae]
MHLNIPVFNVSSTTSTLAPESKNHYNILIDNDDMDSTFCLWDAAAAMGRSSKRDSQSLKPKQPSPLPLGPVWDNLKGLSQLPARVQEKVASATGHGAESPTNTNHDNAPRAVPSLVWDLGMGEKSDLPSLEETGRMNLLPQVPPSRHQDKDARKAINANQRTGDALTQCQVMEAAGKEAASIQAVNRGHSVTLIEVPDEEDDTAYQLWLVK